MADEPPLNHGNHVGINYGTVHQYVGHPPSGKQPSGGLPKRVQAALLGGLATTLLGAWGFYAQGTSHHTASKKAYYCASGNTVKYHSFPTCRGLSSCTARVTFISLAKARRQQMAPCQVCH
jgi:hypothetical protein